MCRIKCAAESLGNKDANKNRFTNEYIICIENECEDPSSRSDLKLLSWRSANTKSEKTITKVKSIKFHWVFNSQLSQIQNVSWVHNDWQPNENRNLQVEVSIKNRHLLGVCICTCFSCPICRLYPCSNNGEVKSLWLCNKFTV